MFKRYDKFLGIHSSEAAPSANSARSSIGMVRDRVRGRLRLSDGYTAPLTLPVLDQVNHNTQFHIDNLVWKDVHSVYIPNEGGRYVTLAVAYYRKITHYGDVAHEYRWGVWANPYYDGGWVDEWRELTENYIIKIISRGPGAKQITVGDNNVPTFAGDVFTTARMVGWSILYDDFTFMSLISAVTLGGSNSCILTLDKTVDASLEIVGKKLWIVRDLFGLPVGDAAPIMPTAIADPFCESIRSEARINSGNLSTDKSLAVSFRDVVFSWSNSAPELGSIKRLVCEHAQGEFDPPSVSLTQVDVTEGRGLELGAYRMKAGFVLEDGQEFLPGTYTPFDVVAEDKGWDFQIAFYLAHLPRRARYIRVYVSKDNAPFYAFYLFDLKTAPVSIVDSGVAPLAVLTDEVTLDLSLYGGIDAEITAQLGRGSSNHGLAKYSRSVVSGNLRFVVGARVNDVLMTNKILVSTISGDGASEWDVFPSESSTTILDVDYSDGDVAICVLPMRERVLVGKTKSLVLLSPDGKGGYDRDRVTSYGGVCAPDATLVHGDVAYWPDHSGIYSYSSRGFKLLNASWIEDWKAYTDSQRAECLVRVDRTNNKMHFTIPSLSVVHILDLEDDEWMREEVSNLIRYVDGAVTTIDFLSTLTINRYGGTKLHIAASVPFHYEWSEVKLEASARFDILVNSFYLVYESLVPITVEMFLDDATSAVKSFTLVATSSGKTAVEIIEAPMGAVCKKFRFKISGTAVMTGQQNEIQPFVEIREMGEDHSVIPSGGDQKRF
jgi:hypothetical protein